MRTNGLIKQLKNKNKQYGEIDGTLPFNLLINKYWQTHPFKGSKKYFSTCIIPLLYDKHNGEIYIKKKPPFWRRTKIVRMPNEFQKLISRVLKGTPMRINYGSVKPDEYDYIVETMEGML